MVLEGHPRDRQPAHLDNDAVIHDRDSGIRRYRLSISSQRRGPDVPLIRVVRATDGCGRLTSSVSSSATLLPPFLGRLLACRSLTTLP
jgi:hypothetical protein